MQKNKSGRVVCLTEIERGNLDVVFGELKSSYSDIEIWSLEESDMVKQWTGENGVQYRRLDNASPLAYFTPIPLVRLNIPEEFLQKADFIFVTKACITKDRYLKGALLNLAKLMNGKSVSEADFKEYLFELYMHFRSARFYVFTSNERLKGDAWSIDYFLIKSFNLRDDRVYSVFKAIDKPTSEFALYDKDALVIRERLFNHYPFKRGYKGVENMMRKVINCFVILNTILKFKVKKYAKREKSYAR